jgi:hypothetical protein
MWRIVALWPIFKMLASENACFNFFKPSSANIATVLTIYDSNYGHSLKPVWLSVQNENMNVELTNESN